MEEIEDTEKPFWNYLTFSTAGRVDFLSYPFIIAYPFIREVRVFWPQLKLVHCKENSKSKQTKISLWKFAIRIDCSYEVNDTHNALTTYIQANTYSIENVLKQQYYHKTRITHLPLWILRGINILHFSQTLMRSWYSSCWYLSLVIFRQFPEHCWMIKVQIKMLISLFNLMLNGRMHPKIYISWIKQVLLHVINNDHHINKYIFRPSRIKLW